MLLIQIRIETVAASRNGDVGTCGASGDSVCVRSRAAAPAAAEGRQSRDTGNGRASGWGWLLRMAVAFLVKLGMSSVVPYL